MYKLFLTLRYLRHHKIVYFCIVGVTVGIMILTIVVSIMNGFQIAMRERIRGTLSHLTVRHRAADLYIPEYGPLVEEIRRLPHVRGAAPRVEGAAQFRDPRGELHTIQIMGIDPAYERDTSDFARYFEEGRKRNFDFAYDDGRVPGAPPVVVGEQSLFGPGDRIHLTSIRFGADKPIICTGEFEVVGRFRTGMTEYDAGLILMPLDASQVFFKLDKGTSPQISQIAVNIDDYDVNRKTVHDAIGMAMVRLGMPGQRYVSVRWEHFRENLLRAVEVEKNIMIMLMFFIIVVAGFNIVAVYTLMVRSKTADIGVIKALGGSTLGVAAIFLFSGLLLALIGAFLGTSCGLLLSYNANIVADSIEEATRAVSHWEPWKRAAAGAGCLVAAGLLFWIMISKRLVTRIVHNAWLVPCWVLGVGLGGLYCVRLVQALPGAAWKGVFGGAFALAAALYLMTAVLFFRRWATERRLPVSQLDVLKIPASVTYSLVIIAAVIAGAAFEAMAAAEIEPGWGLVLFPRDIYYLDRIPAAVDYGYVVFGIAGAAVVSLVCSIFPAVMAARQPAIESIRHE